MTRTATMPGAVEVCPICDIAGCRHIRERQAQSGRPTKPGFYWGRWHTPAPGTADDGEMCSGAEWEVHSVFHDGFGGPDDELLAFVPGVEKSQPLDAFEWGAEVVRHAAAS